MTCIAGVVHDGKVWIGGDSAGVGGLSLTVRADQKVFQNGDFLFGFTSSFRMGQLLRYKFNPPRRHRDDDVFAYMATSFIDALRSCLKDGGYARQIDGGTEMGGTFLVGYAGRLFTIYDDYQVAESVDDFDAVGSGDTIACGVLYATPEMEPEARITLALQGAERLNAGVRAPFLVMSVGMPV